MAKSVMDAPGGGGSGPRELMEPGTYPARLVQVIELGLQPQSYRGEQKEPRQEVSLTYEFVDEFLKGEDGQEDATKPRWLSESFAIHNLDAEKAKSTSRYKVLDPKLEGNGLFSSFLGEPVMVTIVHNPSKKDPNKVYENVDEVSSMRPKDAARCPDLVNKPRTFDIDEPDLEVFLSLPKFIQDKVKNNLEFEGSALAKLLSEGGTPAKAAPAPKQEQEAEQNPY